MIRKDMKARKRTSKVRPNTFEIRLADALEWGIQIWVARSGKKWRISQAPWLDGPLGNDYIGAEFYAGYAKEAGLKAVADEDAGLLPDFGTLREGGSTPPSSGPR